MDSIDIEKYKAMCDLYEFRSLRGRLEMIQKKEGIIDSIEEQEEEISMDTLEELRVMTHLLHSEMINASFLDIKNLTGAQDAQGAHMFLLEELKKQKLLHLFETVEKPLMKVVKDMGEAGITLDVKKLTKMSEELHAQVKKLEKTIHEMVGFEFNIASPKQLGEVLYEKLGLGKKIKKTKTGAKSTNVSELEKIRDEHKVVPLIMEYRELTKLLSTYIDSLPTYVKDDGKIHAHFVQTGAGTGRCLS